LLGLQLYLTGFQFGRFSEAAALAVLVLLLTGIITLAQFKLSGKWVHYTL
jgi:ABC-type sugar transport system permease subunit